MPTKSRLLWSPFGPDQGVEVNKLLLLAGTSLTAASALDLHVRPVKCQTEPVYFRVSLRSPVLWVTPRDLATQKLRVWFHLVLPSTVLIAVWVTAFLAGEKKSSLVQPSPHSSFVAFPLM